MKTSNKIITGIITTALSAVVWYADASQPIQPLLDKVKPGETIVVTVNHNEALTLKVSGTKELPITISCPLGATINSGNAKTIVTQGMIGYYIIDGCKLVSSNVDTSSHVSKQGTVDLGHNFWGDGAEKERGNDGFILRNVYVEGSVSIFGGDILIENSEINGKGVQANCLTIAYAPSDNNIVRNNTIHDCPWRGVWVLQYGLNNSITGNTIWNTGSSSRGGEAIDCDGAGFAVYGCNAIDNTIYNSRGETAILLENCFDCLISGNTIRDSTAGVGNINYNKENGDGFHADKDYKGLMTNTVIRDNTIYNVSRYGIQCTAVRGNQVLNNTIYNVSSSSPRGAISFEIYGGYYCPDWVVTGNVVSNSHKTIFMHGTFPITIDGNFYNGTFLATLYNNGTRTFSQWQGLGYDVHSCLNCSAPSTATLASIPPTATNTATLLPSPTPGATNTPALLVPSATASRTPTATPTQTKTATVTVGSSCILITWPRNLNIRPSDSLNNSSVGYYLYGKTVSIEAVINKVEVINKVTYVEKWAQINRSQFAAIKINNTVYSELVSCPF